MTWFSGFTVMFLNAPQAYLITAGIVGFCFMTATMACQGTRVRGWERARVWDWAWARVGVRVGNGLPYP